MDSFFELAERKGLIGSSGVTGLSQRKNRLLDFTIEAGFALPIQHHGSDPGFGYVANTALSGGFFPCSDFDCRLANADRLARFAALYADHVVIQNPFAHYSPGIPVELLRHRLAGDLAVLNHLRPLIERGIVTVLPPVITLCRGCSEQFNHRSEALKEALDVALERLLESYMDRVQFKRLGPEAVLIEGPSELVTHGSRVLVTPPASGLFGRLTSRKKRQLAAALITPMLEDVYLHQIHARHTSLNYLTDRELDLKIVRGIGSRAVRQLDSAIVEGLSHAVPVVSHIPVDDVLRLRDAEPEAFHVYRNAISTVVREADLTSRKSIEDAFESRIQPELANLDMALRNAHKMARRQLATDAVVTTAAVSIGLLAGTVQPVAGALLAALGGLAALKSAGRGVVESIAEPSIVRDNSFYFLWRMRKAKPTARMRVRS